MKIKYPRTFHLPWSEGKTSDDKVLSDLSSFERKEIVITEKMDGECTTMMKDCIYARSLDSKDHPSRHGLKAFWANINYKIPENWRICGENLYAKHSLFYENLKSYFLVFNIWNEKNECLNLEDTLKFCKENNLQFVPILYQGKFDLKFIKNFKINTQIQEGFVIRLVDSFKFDDFKKSVVKWVRKGHVTTENHWMLEKIIPNKTI